MSTKGASTTSMSGAISMRISMCDAPSMRKGVAQGVSPLAPLRAHQKKPRQEARFLLLPDRSAYLRYFFAVATIAS